MFFRRGRDDQGMVRPQKPSGGRRLKRWLMAVILLLAGLTALGWAGARQLGVVPPAGVLAGIMLDQLSGKEPSLIFPGGGIPGAGTAGTGESTAAPAAGGGSSAGGKGAAPGGTAVIPGTGGNGLSNADAQALLTGNPASTAGKSELQRRIEAKYIARLQSVAGGFQGRLNSLVGAAWNEYLSDRKQGKKVSVLALAGKYIPAGNALEAQCDAQFYAVLDQFKAELSRNNLPLDTAIHAQQAYEQSKAARKRQLLSRALGL